MPGRTDLSDCRDGKRIHEGTYWGAAAKKRTAAIEPEKKTANSFDAMLAPKSRSLRRENPPRLAAPGREPRANFERSRAEFMAVVPPSAEGTYRCSLVVIPKSPPGNPRLAALRRDSGGDQVGGFYGEAATSKGLGGVLCVQPNNLRTFGLGCRGSGIRRSGSGVEVGAKTQAARRPGVEEEGTSAVFGVRRRGWSDGIVTRPRRPSRRHSQLLRPSLSDGVRHGNRIQKTPDLDTASWSSELDT